MKYFNLLVMVLFLLPNTLAVVDLWQPYEDKILYAQTDYPAGTPYTWNVDGEIVEGNTSTVFLVHFDGSLTTSEGEEPLSVESESYENAVYGQGLVGRAFYNTSNNLVMDEGTVEIWFTLKEPIDSPVYESDPYILRHRNNANDQSFYFFAGPQKNAVRFIAYYNFDVDTENPITGTWNQAIQNGPAQEEVKQGEAIYVAATFSLENNVSSFYFNGFKTAQDAYYHPFNLTDEFFIGNENMIIDEVRISNKPKSNEEIYASYHQGVQASNNDIFLDHETSAGSQIRLSIDAESDTKIVSTKKFSVSPDVYILSNRNEIDFQATGSNCKYSLIPKPYSSMTDFAGTLSLQASSIYYNPIYIKCGEDDYAFYRRYRVLPPENNNFPKIVNVFWGSQISLNESLNETAQLAKYDAISLSGGNVIRSAEITKIREINPDVVITFYSNTQAPKPDYGIAAFYLRDVPFRDDHRLRNAAGEYISNVVPEFSHNPLYNLYSGNSDFHDIYLWHLKNIYFEKGIYDGIWFDNYNTFAWWLNAGSSYLPVDIDMDGTDEDLNTPEGMTKFRTLWEEGLNIIGQGSRDFLGQDAILISNGANQESFASILNGKLWEGSNKDMAFSNLINPASPSSFAYWYENSQLPQHNQNMYFDYNHPNDRTRRLGLSYSLMFSLYHYYTSKNDDYRRFTWMDEYWVNLITAEPSSSFSDSGYLGEPIIEYYEIEPGIYRRDFENGIVVVNKQGITKTIDLAGSFRYIQGIKDPAANPGGLTSEITLVNDDARILLRPLCSNNPSNDPLCIQDIPFCEELDLNCDGAINLSDLIFLSDYFGSVNGDGIFDPEIDPLSDGRINILDFVIIANNFD